MMELLRLYGQIALLRRGPQHVPAAPLLLVLTVLGYLLIDAAVCVIFKPFKDGPWIPYLLCDIALTLIWYAVLLRVVRKSERYLQTATSFFGYQLLLSPLFLALQSAVVHFDQQTQASWVLLAVVLALGLMVWLIVAGAHIIRSALEWSMAASVVLVIVQLSTTELITNMIFGAAN